MIVPSINWEYCERETKISKTIRKVSLQISKTSVKKILEDKKFIYSQIIFDFVRESRASYVVLTNLFKNFVNLIIPHEENSSIFLTLVLDICRETFLIVLEIFVSLSQYSQFILGTITLQY